MENKKNEEYAKHYPTVKQDGYYGPITVGNIGEYDGRDLINLCVKTVKSGDRNAVASFPKSWGKASHFLLAIRSTSLWRMASLRRSFTLKQGREFRCCEPRGCRGCGKDPS